MELQAKMSLWITHHTWCLRDKKIPYAFMLYSWSLTGELTCTLRTSSRRGPGVRTWAWWTGWRRPGRRASPRSGGGCRGGSLAQTSCGAGNVECVSFPLESELRLAFNSHEREGKEVESVSLSFMPEVRVMCASHCWRNRSYKGVRIHSNYEFINLSSKYHAKSDMYLLFIAYNQ